MAGTCFEHFFLSFSVHIRGERGRAFRHSPRERHGPIFAAIPSIRNEHNADALTNEKRIRPFVCLHLCNRVHTNHYIHNPCVDCMYNAFRWKSGLGNRFCFDVEALRSAMAYARNIKGQRTCLVVARKACRISHAAFNPSYMPEADIHY